VLSLGAQPGLAPLREHASHGFADIDARGLGGLPSGRPRPEARWPLDEAASSV